ncbi:Carboxysome protein CcmN [Richelia intracellularis]|nr:Carboxysome protein CcmN [Richelia intracellularis]
MSVPPLCLGNNFDSYISGEVIVHPSAAIASGVILQAGSNGKIVIGSGVCIGMGAILQVEDGTLEIEAGANLGAGFLMVGAGKIGENACIGSATTVFNCSVERGQIVVPGSVVGDKSRAIAQSMTTPSSNTTDTELSLETILEEPLDMDATIETKDTTEPVVAEQSEMSNSQVEQSTGQDNPESIVAEKPETSDSQEDDSDSSPPPENFGAHIYGQGSIQQLLITLFPHRQSLNQPTSDNNSD